MKRIKKPVKPHPLTERQWLEQKWIPYLERVLEQAKQRLQQIKQQKSSDTNPSIK